MSHRGEVVGSVRSGWTGPRAVTAALLLILVGLVASACSTGTVNGSPKESSLVVTASAPLSRALDHIHGAAFDDAANSVIVGTHGGAWWVDRSGSVKAAGDNRDDLMGFSVETSGRWLTSGHPGSGSSQPNPLGLLESRDRGQSWASVSQSGVTDFHSLAARGAVVVGYAGQGTVSVSTDGGRTWGDGGAIQATALAYAADRLLAATANGMSVSTDNGHSFSPLPGSPRPVLMSASATSVWIAERDGRLSVSTDGGLSWASKGSVPGLLALAAVDADEAMALTADSVLQLH